jgi:hypothetical protein
VFVVNCQSVEVDEPFFQVVEILVSLKVILSQQNEHILIAEVVEDFKKVDQNVLLKENIVEKTVVEEDESVFQLVLVVI